MTQRQEGLYIGDIIQAISHIEIYTKRISQEKFCSQQMVIDAVIRNFEIIGEAAKHISKKTKSQYPEIPWRDMADMRNKVIHEYFGVDIDIVWETIEKSLPKLKRMLRKLLENKKAARELLKSIEEADEGKTVSFEKVVGRKQQK